MVIPRWPNLPEQQTLWSHVSEIFKKIYIGRIFMLSPDEDLKITNHLIKC